MKTKIDYEIIWCESNKMKFKQFSYEIDDNTLPINSYLPNDVYKFYEECQDKHISVVVYCMKTNDGMGLLRYCGAEPVY